MLDGGNGKPQTGKPLRILGMDGKPISIASDGSVVKSVIQPIPVKYVRSRCCNDSMLIGHLGNGETVIVCVNCKRYIASIVPKPYAFLYQGIPGEIRNSMKRKDYHGIINKQELKQITEEHLEFMVEKSIEFFDDVIDKRMSKTGGDESGEARAEDTDKSGRQTDECETDSDIPGPGREDDPEDDQ